MNRDPGSLALTAMRKRAPLWVRLKGWWNLPRAIGLVAALLSLFHYLPPIATNSKPHYTVSRAIAKSETCTLYKGMDSALPAMVLLHA